MGSLLTLSSRGRGQSYSKLRGLIESTLRLIYPYSWPAHVWACIPRATRVTPIEHELNVLPSRDRGGATLRIAFVSDLHIGPTTPSATLDNAFDLVARWRPDVLILGGDYVFLDATPGRAAELQRRVARIEARTKVAVMGNHDLWTEHNRLEDALHHAGARVLVNDAWTLPAPFDDVAIVGLDEPWTGSIDGARAFDACRGASLRVAVCHSPCGYPSVRGQDVALLLCGHTHGGQIALPGARPVVLPPGACCRTWPHGIHRVDGMALFVSRGLGGTELPVRTFAPPDVGLFVLRE